MVEYIKLETYKIFKNKQWVVPLISLVLFFSLSFFTGTRLPKESQHFFVYYYYIYEVNNEILFPISICVFFSSIYLYDYKLSTIKLLLGSKFSRKNIFFGKFISGSIIIFMIFLILFFIHVFIAFVFFTKEVKIFAGFRRLKNWEIIFRMIVVFMTNMGYLLAIASYITLITSVIKKYSVAVLVSIGSIIAYTMIPIPQIITDNFFLNGRYVYYAMFGDTWTLDIHLQRLSICFVTILIFLGLSTMLFEREEIL